LRKRHDIFTRKERSAIMAKIRSKDTKAELLMGRSLRSLGLRPAKNVKVLGRPDFAFPRKRVAVFCDGDFWHGYKFGNNPRLNIKDNRRFWLNKITKNIQRDAEVNRKLSLEGWRVLRFWEHEIKADARTCAGKVLKVVRARSKQVN